MRADHDSNCAHPAEGVVDSDSVGLVAAPHCQRIACTNPSGKQHAHVLAANMIGPRKVKFSALLNAVAHTNTAFLCLITTLLQLSTKKRPADLNGS